MLKYIEYLYLDYSDALLDDKVYLKVNYIIRSDPDLVCLQWSDPDHVQN
jgi:hypothetical protein